MPPGTNENNRRFYALAYSETVSQLPSKFVLSAGSEWAKVAQRLILEALDTVTNENLMVSATMCTHLTY